MITVVKYGVRGMNVVMTCADDWQQCAEVLHKMNRYKKRTTGIVVVVQ